MVDKTKIKRDVDALIERFCNFSKNHNPIELLSRISIMNLLSSVTGQHHEGNEAQLEYAMSLFLAQEGLPSDPKAPTPDVIQDAIDQLNQLYQTATVYYCATSVSKSGDKIESDVILNQRLQTLHVRGDG